MGFSAPIPDPKMRFYGPILSIMIDATNAVGGISFDYLIETILVKSLRLFEIFLRKGIFIQVTM